MFNPSLKVGFLMLVGCILGGCAPVKEAGRTIGHTTRDVTKEIGHGARDVTREIGHGTRDVVRGIGEGTRDAAKAVSEETKKAVKPTKQTVPVAPRRRAPGEEEPMPTAAIDRRRQVIGTDDKRPRR